MRTKCDTCEVGTNAQPVGDGCHACSKGVMREDPDYCTTCNFYYMQCVCVGEENESGLF